MNFKQAHSSNFKSVRTNSVKYLVIHYTSNDGDTAKNNVDYYARTANLKASAHFYVDTKEVWQSVKEGDTAYHCGANTYKHPYCRNSNSIGIELCSRYAGNLKSDKANDTVDFSKYYFEYEVLKNAAELTRELMAKYNIPIENVIRHYDVTGKTCPAPMVLDNSLWVKFKEMLTAKEENNTSEEMSMTQYEELKQELAIIKAECKALKEAIGTIYKSADEIPDYYKEIIQPLIDKGVIKGVGENNLNLPEISVRTLVFAKRDDNGV